MAYWKIEAQDDTMYVEALTEAGAIDRMESFTGPIPKALLKITEVKKLPKGEELL
jgi:hypothetical protein